MTWSEFLHGLDSFRANIRATRFSSDQVLEGDEMIEQFVRFIKNVTLSQVAAPANFVPPDDPLLSTVHAEDTGWVTGTAWKNSITTDAGSKMTIYPRATPHVHRDPILEDADENTVEDK